MLVSSFVCLCVVVRFTRCVRVSAGGCRLNVG